MARTIAFVDYGAVEDVFAEGNEEVGGGVGGEACWFEGGESVECYGGGLDEGIGWTIGTCCLGRWRVPELCVEEGLGLGQGAAWRGAGGGH